MQNINLYDASLRERRDALGLDVVAAVLGVALLAVAVGTGYAYSAHEALDATAQQGADELQAQQNALQDLARHISAGRPGAAQQVEEAQAQGSAAQRRSALEMLRNGSMGTAGGYADSVRAITRQSVDGLRLVSVSMEGKSITLRGRALDPALVPAYVARLEGEAALRGRSFTALSIARPLEVEAPASPARSRTAGPGRPALAAFVEFSLTGSEDIGAPGPARALAQGRR